SIVSYLSASLRSKVVSILDFNLATSLDYLLFFFLILPSPITTLFPYTTLFRSHRRHPDGGGPPPEAPRRFYCRAGARLCAAAEQIGKHTSELQSRFDLVCRLLLEKKNKLRITLSEYLSMN